jgi:hypothetical protein
VIRRIAVIGPRRRRTGTGPFVSGFLRESGCEVLPWDRAEAGLLLDPGRSRPEVDAVAICSPPETHLDYLRAALAKGLHVFCEKPIVWPPDHSCEDFEGVLDALTGALNGAARDGLTVHENTQWVYTLGDFRRLAGEIGPDDVEHFRCEMSPSAALPAEMTMESSAHANALLLALGCAGIEELSVRFKPDKQRQKASLEFGFRSRTPSGSPVEVEYRFVQQLDQPRHAAYEVNHRRVERRVEVDGYRISLRHETEELAIRDPLRSSVEDFLAKAGAGPAGREPYDRIISNIRMSYALLKAASGDLRSRTEGRP